MVSGTVRNMVRNLTFEGLLREGCDTNMNVKICNCCELYGNVNIADASTFCVIAS